MTWTVFVDVYFVDVYFDLCNILIEGQQTLFLDVNR